jgi:hypothetical protein
MTGKLEQVWRKTHCPHVAGPVTSDGERWAAIFHCARLEYRKLLYGEGKEGSSCQRRKWNQFLESVAEDRLCAWPCLLNKMSSLWFNLGLVHEDLINITFMLGLTIQSAIYGFIPKGKVYHL